MFSLPRFLVNSALTLVLLTGTTGTAGAETASATKTEAETRAERLARQTTGVDEAMAEWNKSDSPGCAIGVVQNGELVVKRGYGLANLDHGILISSNTVFDIGSTSKQFTAAAIALLAEQGKLSLDDDIRRHLPEMPDYGKTITVRHLVHHTSGLRDYLTVMVLAGQESHDVYQLADVVGYIARQKGLNFEPGAEHLYSNSGYILMAAIVERVTDGSMNNYLRQQIFAPLGMEDTRVYDDRGAVIPRRATGYSRNDEGNFFVDHYYNFAVPGDGQIYTTIEDLARWDRVFYEGGVGEEGFVDRLHTRGVLNDGDEINYAFGLGHGEYRGHRIVAHGGAWGGFRAQLMRFPEEHLSVISLCNVGEVDATQVTRAIADVFLDELPGKPLKTSSEDSGASTEKVEKAQTIQLDDGLLKALEGAFMHHDSGEVLQLTFEDGSLNMIRTSLRTERTHRLEPITPSTFRVAESPPSFQVHIESGATRSLRLSRPGRSDDRLYVEVQLAEPSAKELDAYVGEFYSEELDVIYHLRRKDEGLELIIGDGDRELWLKPTVRDQFVGMIRLNFQRDANGAITGFDIDAGRVRGIGFRHLISVSRDLSQKP